MAYEAQIAKGVALLDEKVPGWLDRIDLAALRLDSCSRCVLGQLSGLTDSSAADAMAFQLWPELESTSEFFRCVSPVATEHGFNAPNDDDEYDYLTDEWKATIVRLRAERGR